MATLASNPPSNAPVRSKAATGTPLGGKLRTILAPKPRLVPPPPAHAAFPTRIPIRKKREHCEVALDENETAGDTRLAHIRQRCDSGSSVRTVGARAVRARTDSQETVRTIRLDEAKPVPKAGLRPAPVASSLVESLSDPAHATLSRPDSIAAIANIAKTASALRRTTDHNKTGDVNANSLLFPSSIAPIPVARARAGLDLQEKTHLSSKPRGATEQKLLKTFTAPVKPQKTLKRTHSHRDLHATEAEKDYDRLDRFCATSVEVYEAQVDEAVGEIQRAKELLHDEDEDIVQKVVKDVVEDPAIAAESEALKRPPKGRIVMDDLEEIPDMLSDEEDALPKRGEQAPFIPPPARWGTHERFDVMAKPMNRHTTMWDVDFEDTYAWQGLLFVADAKPYTGIRPHMPIIDLEIEWRTIDACSRTLRSDAEPEYATIYEGAVLPGAQILTQMDPARGIYTQPLWSYLPPDYPGTGEGGAWALRFWVPVPMRLFRGRDVRRFVLDARVAFGAWDVMTGVGHSERVDVTIEHLRRERDMKISAKV
ncbi:uncharacterized protein B0H18DRAFT_1209028 [Fomitopsis serialis]|uniref:uncharacterized protein n=1 Tax=Fomitopsis serialis TaxID=139415 RepID=UPI002007C898|nr:uncharacterized protein B0H18DRAFT_1209028 [Neoantrodia serialis]KAH9931353.1 hypothetical protein B0H18DRAFT_1209028 [Neoantrodia serialis]